MRITDTSDLWWKTAVVYCLDVETFMDWDGDGMRRLRRPGAAHRLPRRARRHLPVADALLPDPRPRRRLRHHRLLRRRPAPGHPRRLRRGHPHGARPRHAGDRRPRRQPHLRQAPVVPGRRVEHGLAVPRLLRLARRPAAGHQEGGRLPRPGDSIWDCRREDRGVVPAPLLPAPARPQRHRTRGCATRSPRSWASGWSSGSRGFRVDAVPFLLETDGRRRAEADASPTRTTTCATLRAFVGRRTGRRHPARRGEPAPRAAAGVLRRRGRRRADHAVRLHRACRTSTCRWPAATPARWPRR